MTSPLRVHDVVKRYGDHVVLDGVDLVAAPGLPLGLVGENGAGKSTLLRILAGVESQEAACSTPRSRPSTTQRRLETLAEDLSTAGAADAYDATLAWATAHGLGRGPARWAGREWAPVPCSSYATSRSPAASASPGSTSPGESGSW
jgi:ABC-type cobalamin/Fe3+-siderophores transport system ATPase subunit